MVCAKPTSVLTGGICDACQDKIRREAMGEQVRALRVLIASLAITA
jgi:hypothetical protein